MGRSAKSSPPIPKTGQTGITIQAENITIEAESLPKESVAVELSDAGENSKQIAASDAPEVPATDPPVEAAEIMAIGKMVSNANGSILKGALDNLLRVAVTSGVLGEDELLAMFVKYDKVAEAVEEAAEADDEQIEASAFTDSTKARVWQKMFDTTVESFSAAVRDLGWCSRNNLINRYKTDDLKQIYLGFVDELVPLLKEMGDRVNDLCYDKSQGLMASAIDSGTELEMPIQLARGNNNKHSFSGTLFQVDRPSEGVPSVGPGVPLFVPREVAIKAIADVSGLPLDAKQGFGGHANKNIVGTMQRAELVGDEVVVHAQLFNWSQPEMVQAIAAQKETLGMSMNANSLGRIRTLQGGTKVFHIDSLELLGANILKAKNATYSKTSVIAAENLLADDDSDLGSEYESGTESQPDDAEIDAFFDAIDVDVAASTSSCPTTPITETDMDLQEISNQITQFSDRVADDMSVVNDQVRVLMEDYNQRAAIQAAALQAQQYNNSRDEMKEMVREVIAGLQASGAISVPDKSARKTIPLAASVRSTTPAFDDGGDSMQVQLQLAAVDAKLEELNSLPNADNLRIIELTDERRRLMYQLSQR